MKLILFLWVFSSSWLFAQEFKLAESTLSYEFEFMMKTVKGISQQARGQGKCNQDSCKFIIAVPIKTFQSGNSNRDLNMLKATKAIQHPMVTLKAEFSKPQKKHEGPIKAVLTFAGVESTRKLMTSIDINKEVLNFKGQLKILLSDFKIERPSLLTMKIPDAILIHYETHWKQ